MESAEEAHEDGEHTHELSSLVLGEANKNEVPDSREVLLEGLEREVLNNCFEEVESLVIVLLGPNQPLENTQDALQILEHIGASLELLEVRLKKADDSRNVGCTLPQRWVEELREDSIVGRGHLSGQLQQQRHHLEDIRRVFGNILGENVLEGRKEKLLEGSHLGRVTSCDVLHDGRNRLKEEVAKCGVLGVLGHLGQNIAQLLDNKLVERGDVLLHHRQNSHDALHGVLVLVTGVVVQPGLLLAFQNLEGVFEDGRNKLLVLVPNTEGLVRVASGDVLLNRHSSVGVDDIVLRGEHLGEAVEEGRVKIKRDHKAESSSELQGISLQDRVPLRERLQIGEDVGVEIIEDRDKRVGGGGTIGRSLVGNSEGRNEVGADVLFPPVLTRVGGICFEALGDVGSQNVGHLGLEIFAKALHKGEGGTSPGHRVRPLDVSADILDRVLTEIFLVGLGEKHVGDNDLLANTAHGRLVVKELVVHAGGGNGEEANGLRGDGIESPLLVHLGEELPRGLSEGFQEGLKLLVVFVSVEGQACANLGLETVEETGFVLIVIILKNSL